MAPNARKRQADSQNKQGSKRRRPQADGDEQDPAATEAALKAYMHHAVRLVHKAVKKAKTFELQKLTRKLKQTREPKEGVQVDAALLADLEAQLAALKTLDLDPIPTHLLTTRLSKLHSLRTSPLLPVLLSSLPSPTSPWAELDPQSAASKARNRVLAHKAIGDSWDEVSRAVRKRLGEEVDAKVGEKKVEVKKGITMDPGRQAAIEAAFLGGGGEGGGEGEEGEEGAASSEDEGPAGGLSDDEGPAAGSEDEDDDEEAIAREMAALEEGVGSEGDWSGSDSDDDLAAAPSTSTSAKKPLKRRQPSLSPSPPPTAKKARALAPSSKPITSSSFLPSLNAGYVSYSDSDGEDAKWVKDAEREDRKEAGGRKNRRGQRARQAIWEKKYGTAANHVVKQTGGTLVPLAKIKDDKAARSARRAAAAARGEAPASTADAPERKRREFEPPKADLGWKARSGPSSAPSSTSTAAGAGAPRPAAAAAGGKPAEKMHPSWEAKRKQAEALKQVSALKPQGKKITFD